MSDEAQLPTDEPDGDKKKKDEEDELVHLDVPDETEAPEGRDRHETASEAALAPDQLAGSWFHRLENGAITWQGLVVGEVRDGPDSTYYLLELHRCAPGASKRTPQVIVRIDQMVARDEGYEYRFYDSQEEMVLAAAEYTVETEVEAE